MGRKKKVRRDGTAVLRRVVSFDEKSRRCFGFQNLFSGWLRVMGVALHMGDIKEFLTGFHKRKVERRKAALEEIKHKLKEEEKKMKEERHKEYMKMLKEREEALEEADELEHLVTSQTESVSYDHPNHMVTVTTISDLDLSGARVLGLTENENTDLEGEDALNTCTLPKKARDPLLSERISSLTASLHSRTQKKRKRKQINHKQGIKNRGQNTRTGRTSKSQRRKMTGRKRHVQD